MVTREARRVARAALIVASVAPLASIAACAAVWGFDPLTQAPDEADGGDASTGADGSPLDAHPTTDGGCASCGDGSAGPGLQCQAFNGTCTCAVNNPSNDAPCSPASLGIDASTVICCADPSYPTSGQCTCQWIGCTNSNGNCICGPGNDKPGGTCAAAAWNCCLQNGAPQCVCSTLACQVGFTPFGNACGIADVKCGGAQQKVASCNK